MKEMDNSSPKKPGWDLNHPQLLHEEDSLECYV